MNKKIVSVFERLSFRPLVGGLEINDSALRFLQFDGEKPVTASLRLPPGIILDGKINDRQNFLSALKTIHSQLAGAIKVSPKVHVIVSLPASVVYSQSFSIPKINHKGLEETVGLNLQMVSPIGLEKAYSDWQIIGENANQREILGAFVENFIVDDYDKCLRESGFLPLAFEFSALSLTRLVRDLGPTLDLNKAYLVVDVSTDGLNFMIIRKGELCFNHFLFWRTLQGEKRQIIFSDFKDIIIKEVRKVINFSVTNFKDSFAGAIVTAPALEKEIGEIIQEEFALEIIPLRLRRYNDFSAIWFTALGLALRGLIPRRQDTLISLTGHNVVEEFYHEQTLSAIALWRNIFVISLSVLLVAFIGVDVFFWQVKKNIGNQLSALIVQPQIREVNTLQTKAKLFNQLVTLISTAKKSSQKWFPFFEQLNDLAGNQIVFDRILIQSLSLPVRIQGRADNEKTIVNFKNTIADQPNLEKVNLPLTGIRPTADRRLSFELSFVIKSLNR